MQFCFEENLISTIIHRSNNTWNTIVVMQFKSNLKGLLCTNEIQNLFVRLNDKHYFKGV